MNDFENKISNMLPSDLIKVKKLIDILLDYKINNTRTNLEYLKKSKTIECANNPNHRVKKIVKKMVYNVTTVMIAKNLFH